MTKKFDEPLIRTALAKAWSLETAKQWLPETPSAGQCNVTTVVVYDLFGGDILRTKVPGYDVDHYYNRIDGRVVDLTDGQFNKPVSYDDEAASREDAMACVLQSEYDKLRSCLLERLA